MPKTKRDLTTKEIALLSQLSAANPRRITVREAARMFNVSRISVIKSLLSWQKEYEKTNLMPSVVTEK